MSAAAWMTSTIRVASVTGADSYGKATFSTPRAVAARVELGSRLVRDANGEQVSSQARVFSVTPIKLTDRVWLPGFDWSDVNASSAPLAVRATPDKAGLRTFYEVDI